jgi:hypothetical protein
VRVGIDRSLLIAHCSLLIAHCSLLIAHCSLLIAHCSLLIGITEARERLIYKGKTDIVAAIKHLPQSKHMLDNIIVDCMPIPVVVESGASVCCAV